MKKIFTLLAAALMAVGAQAQMVTLSFESYKNASNAIPANNDELTDVTLSDATSGFSATFKSTKGKYGIDSGKTFGATDTDEQYKLVNLWKPGQLITGNETASISVTVPKDGTLYIFARTSSSGEKIHLMAKQEGTNVLDVTYATRNVVKNSADKNVYPYAKVAVKAGTVEILTDKPADQTDVADADKVENANFYGLGFIADPAKPQTVGTLWTFDDAAATYTELTSYNNLWIHAATGGHAVNKVVGDATVTLSSGTTAIVSNYLEVPGNNETSIPNALSKRREANNNASLGEYLAFDVDQAGTAYVMIRTKDDNAERKMRMNFQLASDNFYTQVEKTASKELTELKLEATGAGTFFIYGTMAVRVFAVNWVPSGSNGISVATAAKADGKWYNLQGQEVSAPTKGLFIKNGKKYIIK